jgi:hypothetical protein
MRRWFAVFLLILVPLQLSWAVAATYCGHEEDPAARHVGHHEHRHEGEHRSGSSPESPSADAAKATHPPTPCVDDDCGFCHLGHTQPVASTPLELPAVNGPIARAAAPESWSSRGPDRRERPNWRTA